MMVALAIALVAYYLGAVVYMLCDTILCVRDMRDSGELTDFDMSFVLALVATVLLTLLFAPLVFPWALWHQIKHG